MARLELTGQRSGRLVAITRTKVPGANNAMWRCICDCGNTTVIAAANFGITQSCGCLAKETASVLIRSKHAINTKHGMSGTPEYTAWTKMKLRCYDVGNPRYYTYGAKGILVCDRWRNSFENFFADLGPRPSPKHSLGRIDNNKGYEPSNCRWELPIQQANNTRRSRIVEINGIRMTVSEWCRTLKVYPGKPYEMTKPRGQFDSVEEALSHLWLKKR